MLAISSSVSLCDCNKETGTIVMPVVAFADDGIIVAGSCDDDNVAVDDGSNEGIATVGSCDDDIPGGGSIGDNEDDDSLR